MLNLLSCRTGRSIWCLAFRILVGFLLNKAVMHSWRRWPVSNSLLPCVCVFVCAVNLSLTICVNTRKKRGALLLHTNEVWGEKAKHFLQNKAVLFLIELGQIIHVFLPPQWNLFLRQLLSFIPNLCNNCTCQILWITGFAFIDSTVNLTRWKHRFLKWFWGEEPA